MGEIEEEVGWRMGREVWEERMWKMREGVREEVVGWEWGGVEELYGVMYVEGMGMKMGEKREVVKGGG